MRSSSARIRSTSWRAAMRSGIVFTTVGLLVLAAGEAGRAQQAAHLNPMIALHMQSKPLFGLYAPSNPRARGTRGSAPGAAGAAAPAPATPPPPVVLKSPVEL